MPYVLAWLEEAGDHASRFSARISRLSRQGNLTNELATLVQHCQQDLPKRKLSAIYQFIKGMPELYIESRLFAVLHQTRTTRVGLLQEQSGLQRRLEENDLQEQECLRALKSRRLNLE